MPIEPKRIEAAARAILREHVADNGAADAIWAENLAIAALAAGFPELASDPPTAWVAPWEATEAMIAVMDACDGHSVYDSNASGPTHYEAARDACTKEQT